MSDLQIKPFDWRGASETEYVAFNAFRNAMRKEWFPDDPPIPLNEEINGMRHRPASDVIEAWMLWHETAIVGMAQIVFRDTAENRHAADVHLEVLPAYRRQGWGRRLLAKAIELPRRANRRLLLVWTKDDMPSGEAFMQRLGAQRGLVERVSQLKLSELNHELLRVWMARAPERALGFEVGFWDGALPEAYIADIARLHEILNDAPRGSLQLEDEHITPELIRQWEKSWFARGTVHWMCYAREKTTGKFAGFTETFWQPNRPHLMYQGGTGVFPYYRNKGLGRWLKAAMIERVLRERPDVQIIRTDNAETNAAMLNINYQLGFKHYCAQSAWQVELETVEAYLQGR
jgi:GNAT superfamily N-acetyltransferase